MILRLSGGGFASAFSFNWVVSDFSASPKAHPNDPITITIQIKSLKEFMVSLILNLNALIDSHTKSSRPLLKELKKSQEAKSNLGFLRPP